MRARTAALAAMMVIGSAAPASAQPPVSDNPYGEEPEDEAGAEGGEGGDAPAGETDVAAAEGAAGGSADTEGGAEGESEPGEGAEGGYRPIWEAEEEEEEPSTARSSSSAAAGPSESDDTDTEIPLEFELEGYFRSRAVWTGNVPIVSDPSAEATAQNAYYATHRLRLNPSVQYGSDEDNLIASLHFTIDALDNVVWGDNARLANTPLFASDLSITDIEGFDLEDSLRLKRAWLQFLIPIGQIRIGRMPSHWGLGILAHDGNGIGEWNDPQFGTTVDRILFATRPLTIYNAIARGDARPTPLIFAVAYDKLVEDPLRDPTMDLDGDPADPETRSVVPFRFLADGADDVQEAVVALMWRDDELNPNREDDALHLGFYFVERWQGSTNSDVHIFDLYWKFQYAMGDRLPSFYTEGEIVTIQGTSQAISLPGGCGPDVCNETSANIWGAVGRFGAVDREERWRGYLELGYSSGDGQLFNDDALEARALHQDYHVGMLTYQVAMLAATSRLGEDIRPLWSNGGVWNSRYIYPSFRYTILPGIEAHGAILLSWADQLLPTVYLNERASLTDTSCGLFEGDCFIGFETDLALRIKWGENDLMRWDNEFGFMIAGPALHDEGVNFGISEPFLWTFQSRIAMVF